MTPAVRVPYMNLQQAAAVAAGTHQKEEEATMLTLGAIHHNATQRSDHTYIGIGGKNITFFVHARRSPFGNPCKIAHAFEKEKET